MDVRQLKITGGAVDHYHKVKSGGSRKRTKQMLQEGGDDAPGPQITGPTNINAARRMMNGVKILRGGNPSTLPGSNPQDATKLHVPAVNANLAAGIAPMPATPATTLQTAPPLQGQGQGQGQGQTGGKLTLVPAKKKTQGRVILAPPASKKSRIRETRKIRVQLSGLKKRMTKAKAIHKDSREKSIAEVRKLLEDAKLVKPPKEGKSVPDSVLRDIYKDYLLLRNRAL